MIWKICTLENKKEKMIAKFDGVPFTIVKQFFRDFVVNEASGKNKFCIFRTGLKLREPGKMYYGLLYDSHKSLKHFKTYILSD